MNKKYIISKNEEISNIVKNGKKVVSRNLIVYYIENKQEKNRYCFSVSKKIGNAVTRNSIRRKIKDILMKNPQNFNKDYVIIARKGILNLDHNKLKEEILYVIKEKIK